MVRSNVPGGTETYLGWPQMTYENQKIVTIRWSLQIYSLYIAWNLTSARATTNLTLPIILIIIDNHWFVKNYWTVLWRWWYSVDPRWPFLKCSGLIRPDSSTSYRGATSFDIKYAFITWRFSANFARSEGVKLFNPLFAKILIIFTEKWLFRNKNIVCLSQKWYKNLDFNDKNCLFQIKNGHFWVKIIWFRGYASFWYRKC